MSNFSNLIALDTVLATAYEKGKTEGAGLSTPVENAKFIVEVAQQCKIDAKALKKYYREYARGKNDGNVNGHQIDLTEDNAKSLDAQASKLGIFPKLAEKDGGSHADLIDRTVKAVLAIDGKKPSVYEMVLKAARAQCNGTEIMIDGVETKIGGSRRITDDELVALVTPNATENTRITQLERAIATAEGKASLLTDEDQRMIVGVLYARLDVARADLKRRELEDAMDIAADDLGWNASEYKSLGLKQAA